MLVVCRRVSSWMPLQTSARRLAVSPQKASSERTSILVDLPLPHGNNENIQRLLNDIVLAKVIDGTPYDKCFLRITDTTDASSSLLFGYVSELYSKSWNEAVAKKQLGLTFLVLHELLVSDPSSLQQQRISKVFTHDPSNIDLVAWRRSQASLEVVDTRLHCTAVLEGLAGNPLLTFLDGAPTDPSTLQQTSMIFDYVAVGGSFDQLHSGHRKLLSLAAACCDKELTVGVTGDAMLVNKAHHALIESLPARLTAVRAFLSFMKPSMGLNLVEINDPFGPAVTDSRLQAIIVSSETISGAFKINHIRKEKGMNVLHVLVISRADAAILSSSFLREQRSRLVV